MWIFIGIIVLIILFLFLFFFAGKKALAENIHWGVNFSPKQASDLGLDPKEIYLNILNDLKADNIRIAVHWDLIEKEKNVFDLSNIDFYINEANKKGIKIILAIGMKTPRWPEYHMPDWTMELSEEEQKEQILEMISFVMNRYKDEPCLLSWQIENEPFFNFGKAPWKDNDFIKKEVDLAKKIDDKHDIVITDSGEMSFWFKAAKLGDIVGITMYTKVWSDLLKKDFNYFLPAVFYGKKADLVELIFKKNVWCLELQAEPWCEELIQDSSKEEQFHNMSLNRFKQNIEFAKATGLDTFYFWGVEWWYYMKDKNNEPSFLDEAKKLWN